MPPRFLATVRLVRSGHSYLVSLPEDYRPGKQHEARASRVLVLCSPRQIASIVCRMASQGDLRRASLGAEDKSLQEIPLSWECRGDDIYTACSVILFCLTRKR